MTATHSGASSIRWHWIVAIWCAGGLFDATQAVLILRFAHGSHESWLPVFATEMATWLPWVLATPWIIGLARRHPFVRGTTLRTIAVHVAAFATLAAVAEGWTATLQVLFNPWGTRQPPQFWDSWSTTLLYHVLIFLIAYALILTVTYLMDSRDKVAHQMTETARLNEELSKAQLAALRRQMEPHFMFNALNSIAGLVRDRRNDAAVSMIVGLSEFLRRAADNSRPQVTLAEEVEYLQRYVDIQKLRFGERLRVSVEIPQDLLDAQVPSLLLQPLVENAIKHGVAERVSGGAVRVTGQRSNGRLQLSVYNDAAKLPPAWPTPGTGVGLSNLRTRLQILHGDAAELRMGSVGTDGVEVVVVLPFKEG